MRLRLAAKSEEIKMNLHSLTKTEGSTHRRIRLGRGRASGKGKTSGKGHKGYYARSGSPEKAGFEGGQMPMYRRLGKRGFNNIFKKTFAPVNLSELNRFDEGAEINEDLLRQAGLVNGNNDGVKILGTGSVDKKLTIKVTAFSASAKAAIEAAGGVCETV
jgi:large subunit ribosomal protein L15